MSEISIDVDNVNNIPTQTMLRVLDYRKRVEKSSALFIQAVKNHPGLFARLEQMDIEPRFDTYITLNFAGNGEQLGEVWGLLRSYGWKTESHPQKGQTSYSGFWYKDDEATIWLYFTSTVCKQVQVGTKMVEQPIYEVQCGNEDLGQIGQDSNEVAVHSD